MNMQSPLSETIVNHNQDNQLGFCYYESNVGKAKPNNTNQQKVSVDLLSYQEDCKILPFKEQDCSREFKVDMFGILQQID